MREKDDRMFYAGEVAAKAETTFEQGIKCRNGCFESVALGRGCTGQSGESSRRICDTLSASE